MKLEPKSREIRDQFERQKAAHAEARSAEECVRWRLNEKLG